MTWFTRTSVQSTGDTEVIIHLVATSSYTAPLDRLTDALKQVEGAYSLAILTPDGLVACRDPLGIRPLVMGKLGEATIFASESVALDVIGATFLREIDPGELVIVNDTGTLFGVLAVVHTIECIAFLGVLRKSARPLAENLWQTFLFGIIHVSIVRGEIESGGGRA